MSGIGECRPDWHDWEFSEQETGNHKIMQCKCRICHAGHMMGLLRTSDTTFRADFAIFGANGSAMPSQTLKLEAMSMYAETMGDLRAAGFTVIQGNITIGGPR